MLHKTLYNVWNTYYTEKYNSIYGNGNQDSSYIWGNEGLVGEVPRGFNHIFNTLFLKLGVGINEKMKE